MKTANLTGVALDWAVAKCEGLLGFGYRTDGERFAVEDSDGEIEGFMPSTDWAQGGPIIEQEWINVVKPINSVCWIATMHYQNDDDEGIQTSEEQGTTPLIAAMRCYVASKLGDEIELPEGLTNE